MFSKNPIKLQTKLFITYFFLVLAILFFFAVFFYFYVSRRLEEREMSALKDTETSVSMQIENTIRAIDSVAININYVGLIQKPFDDSFNLNISKSNQLSLMTMFMGINGSDTKADYIYLYDFKGNVLQLDNYTTLAEIDIDKLSWVSDLMQSNNSRMISCPIYKKTANYSQWMISLYRVYYNQYGRAVGLIETAKGCKSLFRPIMEYQKKTVDFAEIYIYDGDGALVYPYDLDENEKESALQYYKYAGINSGKGGEKISTDMNKLISASTMNYTGWTYVLVQDKGVILEPINDMLKVLFTFTAILFILALLYIYAFSRSLVKPIKHLKHIIQRMQIDTLDTERLRGGLTSVVELNELYLAFDQMCKKLKKSMNELIKIKQQELKSRNLALQSQINPHFYYNSLSNIIVLAEDGRTSEIQQMCLNLTSIMRYITDNTKQFIPLRDELDYVNRYLYCMKVRYQSNLEYYITIPDEMMEIRVPKLFLQPIVENAIKYGFVSQPPWKLYIAGEISPSEWHVDVTDPGTGFTDEVLKKLEKDFKKSEDLSELPELHIDGLGLINVYLRWKYYFKDDMIFKCSNTKEGHGVVTMGCRSNQKEEGV